MIEFVFDRTDLAKDKEYINLYLKYDNARNDLLKYLERKTGIRVIPAPGREEKKEE